MLNFINNNIFFAILQNHPVKTARKSTNFD